MKSGRVKGIGMGAPNSLGCLAAGLLGAHAPDI